MSRKAFNQKRKNFRSNRIIACSIVFTCVLLHIAKKYLNIFAYCFLSKCELKTSVTSVTSVMRITSVMNLSELH